MNELKVTDGTTTVNLLNLEEGWSVDGWIQAVAQYKGGGTWQQSALTDEARLVAKAFDNVTEEIPIPAVSAGREDVAAAALRVLIMLLEKASDYWTDDWRDEPVWLESQAEGETNKQYATIYTGGFPDIGDPYSHAYLESAALAGLTLRVVHGHWTDNAPKVGTALPLSARETFDSRWFGNVDDTGARETTTAAEVFSVNKRLECNITHAYRVTNAGAWTDLIAAGPPVALLPPAGHAAGDFVVFGIECAGNLHYLFSNLIFDISTTNTDLDTIWEYWDGAAPWGGLIAQEILDNTDTAPAGAADAFTVAGVNGAWWMQPTDWVRASLFAIFGGAAPAITGYWVRCRVTAVGAAPVSPIQQNRDVYACQWPYVEVQAADIEGHVDAVCKLLTENRSGSSGYLDKEFRRVLGGLRSMERGETFVSHINLSGFGPAAQNQNPAGIDVEIYPPVVDTTWQVDTSCPAGSYLLYNPGVDRALAVEFYVEFDNVDFYGTFRLFLRCKQIGGAASDIMVWPTLEESGVRIWTGPQVYTRLVGHELLLDFGEITLPGISPFESGSLQWLMFYIQNTNGANADLACYDIILLPIDEFCFDAWSLDVDTWVSGIGCGLGIRLEIDSIIDPKRLMRTLTKYTATDYLHYFWRGVASDRLPFHPDKRQRYWFVYETNKSGAPTTNVSYFYIGARNQMQAVQRYLSRRGAG